MAGIANPILFDFPDTFDTERLTISAPRPGDGQIVHSAILESHKNLRPFIPWAKTLQTPEQVEEALRRSAAQFLLREDLRLNIWRKSDGRFVGGTGLHRINWSVPRFEIGYWVRTSLEGQGYVTEAVMGLTRFAFETLKAERVEIRCDSRNERSAAVARRAGYTLEGVLRNNDWANDGLLCDLMVFALLRNKYPTKAATV